MLKTKLQQSVQPILKMLADYQDNGTNWKLPWVQNGFQRNGTHNKPYRGANALFTGLVAYEKGYTDPRWLTFKQAKKLGGHVSKGETGTSIFFFDKGVKEKLLENGETEIQSFKFSY